jgi:uncharacterized protein YbaA (DUF1428 family)
VSYIDGFVIPVPKKNVATYRRIASRAGRIWMEHGALQYIEAVGDDLKTSYGLPFPRLTRLKPGEIVLFSFVVYRSRAQRDRVNKKIMSDPRILRMMEKGMPFDERRMSHGGFRSIVAFGR